jgi:steroid delta-isomerase-like uncharacterized protein
MIKRAAIAALAVAVFAAAAGCGRSTSSAGAEAAARNEALVRRWIDDGFNKRRLAVVDELFAKGFAVNGTVIGRDGLRHNMQRHLDGFPDLHVTIDDLVADASKVAIWYTAEGTHHGEFEGVGATGRRVKWIGSDLLYLDAEKITNALFVSDMSGLLAQLGAAKPPLEGAP